MLYGDLGIDAGTVQLPAGTTQHRRRGPGRGGHHPADRGRISLFGDQSLRDNISAVRTLALTVDRLLLRTSDMNKRAMGRRAQLDIRAGRTDMPVRALSSGVDGVGDRA